MNQVHKENLSQVENALPNRQGLEVEIFGMEGIPQDILDQHRNRIIQNFYQAQEDRRLATGNPLPGQALKNSRKKIKIESAEELKKRLEEFRAQKKAAPASGGEVVPPQNGSPGSFVSIPSHWYFRSTNKVQESPFSASSAVRATLRPARFSCAGTNGRLHSASLWLLSKFTPRTTWCESSECARAATTAYAVRVLERSRRHSRCRWRRRW